MMRRMWGVTINRKNLERNWKVALADPANYGTGSGSNLLRWVALDRDPNKKNTGISVNVNFFNFRLSANILPCSILHISLISQK
jgi:hypothetical protein